MTLAATAGLVLALAQPIKPPPPMIVLKPVPEPVALETVCAFVEMGHGPAAVCVSDVRDLIDSPQLVEKAYAIVEATILVGGPEL